MSKRSNHPRHRPRGKVRQPQRRLNRPKPLSRTSQSRRATHRPQRKKNTGRNSRRSTDFFVLAAFFAVPYSYFFVGSSGGCPRGTTGVVELSFGFNLSSRISTPASFLSWAM